MWRSGATAPVLGTFLGPAHRVGPRNVVGSVIHYQNFTLALLILRISEITIELP